jgi:starch synthase
MQHAVARAFALYSDTERWQSVQRNDMSIDCDWAGPTRAYIEAYAHVADMAVRPLFAARPLAVERPAAQVHAQHERAGSPAAAIAAALAGVVGVPVSVAAA